MKLFTCGSQRCSLYGHMLFATHKSVVYVFYTTLFSLRKARWRRKENPQ